MIDRLQQAKSVDIFHYLVSQGYKPVRDTGRKAYFLSPKREESHPSFEVDRVKNRFADYGESKAYGDVVDMVAWLNDVSTFKAIDILMEGQGLTIHRKEKEDVDYKPIQIIEQQDRITNEAIRGYLEVERKIPIEIAEKYCKQVLFQFHTRQWVMYYGVGMPNDKGGFSIRSVWFKGATSPAGITTVHPGSEEVSIFEGAMDFLTHVVLNGDPEHCCIILHSLVFLPMMDEELAKYKRISLYLDNDPAGDQYTQAVIDKGYPVVDQRHLFTGYSDYNEKLQKEFDI